MVSQHQSTNISNLLENPSLMQDLYSVFTELYASQLDGSNTRMNTDYIGEEDDNVCRLRKRKTKKTKFEQCKDKNTKAFLETPFDRVKRAKVARAAKRTRRRDLRSVQETPFQGFEPINPVKGYNMCNSFSYRSDARTKKVAEIKAAAKKAVERAAGNIWLYNHLQDVLELTADW